MSKPHRHQPILTALLLGGWATVYIAAAVLAIGELFPVIASVFPPLPTILALSLIPTRWIYLTQLKGP